MGKYNVEVGSFCTRMVTRHITVSASSEDEAMQKAIDKFIDKEYELGCSSDAGSPQVNSIEEVES